MGCTSSDLVQSPTLNYFKLFQVPSGSIETTQVFMTANDYLTDVKDLYFHIESSRMLMFRITKVSLISNPTLLDAYIFWTNFVALCNQGKGQNSSNVFYSFKTEDFVYSLGDCGDLKLQWFGRVLDSYIKTVHSLKTKLPLIIEQLKAINETIVRLIGPNELKNSVVQNNKSKLKSNMEFLKIISQKLTIYAEEISELLRNHIKIEENSASIGEQLYKKYGVNKIQQFQELMATDKFIMKTKASVIVKECFNGKFRSELEEAQQQDQKAERNKRRPHAEKGDDIGIGLKKFPFRIRWTGCKMIDQSLSILSLYLEEHSTQLLMMRRYSISIRYLCQTFRLKEDNIESAWTTFCKVLAGKERQKLNSSPTVLEGLKAIRLKEEQAEKCRQFFVKYIDLFDQKRISELDEMWANYLINSQRILILWSDNQILDLSEFKSLNIEDKYYALTSLAKNIYALQHYYNAAIKVYQNYYLKKLKKGLKFIGSYVELYQSSYHINGHLGELYAQLEQNDQISEVAKKKTKFQYAYEKFSK